MTTIATSSTVVARKVAGVKTCYFPTTFGGYGTALTFYSGAGYDVTIAISGRLQNVTEYCIEVHKTGPASIVEYIGHGSTQDHQQ